MTREDDEIDGEADLNVDADADTDPDTDVVEADGGQDANEDAFGEASSGDEEIHGYPKDEPPTDEDPEPDPGSQTQGAAADATAQPDPEEIADEPMGLVTQSPVVKTASRTLTPFVIAFGIYLTLFGTSLPGGAFQGGVVMASAIVLIALSFGFEPTREWLDERALAGLFLLGAGLFGGIAFGAVVLGGAILEPFVYAEYLTVEDVVKLVEVAIAALVSGVIIGAVIWLASGVGDESDGGESL